MADEEFRLSGGIRKRVKKNGVPRYQAYINVPDPERPGHRYQVVRTFGKRAEARAWLDTEKATLRKNPPHSRRSGKAYLKEFLPYWLNEVAVHQIRPTTMRSYRQMIAHAVRELGDIALDKLTAIDIQDFYAKLLRLGKSHGTARYAGQVLHTALADAERWNLIPDNPARHTKVPVQRSRPMRALTWEEVRRLLAAADADTHRVLWYFYLLTGVRRGEALGIEWREIDWDHATVHICRTVHTDEGHSVPKTPSSDRLVALPPDLLDMLRAHRMTQQQEQAGYRVPEESGDWVFATRTGRLLSPRNVGHYFKDLLKKANLPPSTRIHDMRHSHATLMLAQGVPIKVVSERLGHSDVAMTLRIYSHVLPGVQAEAARNFALHLSQLGISPEASVEPASSTPEPPEPPERLNGEDERP